jgi:signal transduction histidine kinase
MTAVARRSRLARRLRYPKTTVRWRLTLLYGGLFLVSGIALLAITYTLVDHATISNAPFRFAVAGSGGARLDPRGPQSAARRPFYTVPPGTVRKADKQALPPPVQKLLKTASGRRVIVSVGSVQRISDLHQLVIESSIALAIMAIVSGALGWVVAGRVLAPLRTMTAATQQMSEENLHERLAMQGPPDELRQLADTIDGLLGRLEGAFDAQRRFVANASHELRTPLTTVRALLEMILSDPGATVGTFRTTCKQVLEESAQQEQLIDALLALAHGQRGLDAREPIDLAVLVGRVVDMHEADAIARGIRIDACLDPSRIVGDPRLIERLVSNLLDNAIRHNDCGGSARVAVAARGGAVELAVSNTGPVVPADEVQRLLQPFQRRGGERIGHRDGLGLGLSIVAAIAEGHGAALDVVPGREGGLDVSVRFAAARASDLGAALQRESESVALGLVPEPGPSVIET